MGVLFKNADVTIYNHYMENGIDKYQSTVILGVNWNTKRNSAMSDKGLIIFNNTNIFVDKLDSYVSPRAFANLTALERPNYFTFDVGDKIVKGSIEDVVTKIADLSKNYDNVVTIVNILDSKNHWEVVCK